MNANPILLQKKYARIIVILSEDMNISLSEALSMFYESVTYEIVSEGIADMHCMSDTYIAHEVEEEYL